MDTSFVLHGCVLVSYCTLLSMDTSIHLITGQCKSLKNISGTGSLSSCPGATFAFTVIGMKGNNDLEKSLL